MHLHIYLWKHAVLVDEWEDEYVRAFMNTTSIYVFTFECKLIYSYMTYGFPIRSFSFQLSKFLVIARFPTNFNFLSFKKKKNHFPSLTKILGYYVSTRMYP